MDNIHTVKNNCHVLCHLLPSLENIISSYVIFSTHSLNRDSVEAGGWNGAP